MYAALSLPFWWRWVVYCTLGELLGISLVAAIAVAHLEWLGEPQNLVGKWLQLLIMLGAGTLEGLLLGWFQARMLQRRYPGFELRAWWRMTALAAAIAWLLGMVYPVFFVPLDAPAVVSTEPDLLLSLLLYVGAGAALGTLVGAMQARVLRQWAYDTPRWIVGNAFGWAIGLGWMYLGASLPSLDTPVWLIVALGAAGGILAGLSLGIVTGLVMGYIVPKSEPTTS